MKRTGVKDVEMAGQGQQDSCTRIDQQNQGQAGKDDPVELDWHDVSLILAMLELTPAERIRRGEEMARQARAFRDAVREAPPWEFGASRSRAPESQKD